MVTVQVPGVVQYARDGIILLAVLALAGCFAEPAGTVPMEEHAPDPTAEPGHSVAPIGTGPSPEARERQYDRTETDPTTTLDPAALGYVATRVVTLANRVDLPLAYAVQGDLLSVRVEGWDESRYEAKLTLYAYGFSEQDARDHVTAYRIEHSDVVDQGAIRVETRVVVPADPPPPPAPGVTGYGARAELVLRMPGDIAEAAVEVANGGITVAGLTASEAAFSSGNGQVEVSNVTAERLWAVAHNGGVSGDSVHASDLAVDSNNGGVSLSAVRAGNIAVHARNGGIEAAITAISNGTWQLTSGNGGADVQVATADEVGFDIVAQTSNGAVSVDVGDTKPVGPQTEEYAHVRTNGFSQRPHQVVLGVDSGNGSVQVRS